MSRLHRPTVLVTNDINNGSASDLWSQNYSDSRFRRRCRIPRINLQTLINTFSQGLSRWEIGLSIIIADFIWKIRSHQRTWTVGCRSIPTHLACSKNIRENSLIVGPNTMSISIPIVLTWSHALVEMFTGSPSSTDFMQLGRVLLSADEICRHLLRVEMANCVVSG